MKRIIVLLFTLQATVLCQQGRLIQNPMREVPKWVRSAFSAQKLDSRYLITLRRYPRLLKGDFNADNRRDVVLQIEEKTGGKEGIAIFQGPRPQAEATHVVIIGAGKKSEEFPEDLRSFPRWSLLSRNNAVNGDGTGDLPAGRNADAIRFETADSATASVYWDGKKYQWHAPRKQPKE
jgi:hypothetical protein